MAFITVGAVGRSFRFLPTRDVRELLLYALAVVLGEYDVLLHEFEWLSNHYHLVVSDPKGELPKFMRDLNSLISRGLNALRGHQGTNIEKGYNLVRPQDDEKVVEHSVYTLTNACEAHLVSRTGHWKGPSSFKMRYGQPIVVSRPRTGLWKHDIPHAKPVRRGKSKGRLARRKPSKLPLEVELVLTRPPILRDLSDDELRDDILRRVDERERELIAKRKQSGERVLGMKKVLQQNWEQSPRSRREMFKTTPNVSARSKWARIEALQRRKGFIAAYNAARDAFIAGDRDVLFPPGTWLMRTRYRVCCQPYPAPS